MCLKKLITTIATQSVYLYTCLIEFVLFFSSSFELFVVSFMQEDEHIGHTALALAFGLQVFS